jgi:tetratricopeptide (TPR) repeat protein
MRSRLFAVLSVVFGLLLATIAAVLFGHGSGLAPNDVIEETLAKLNIKPRTVEMIPETAARARQAVKNGDFAVARKIVAEVIAKSHVESWRYYPFDAFIEAVGHEQALEGQLDKWVAQNRNDAIPLLMRAQFDQETGWARRGHDYAGDVPALAMTVFVDYMNRGLADVEAAIAADNTIPYSYYLRMQFLRGFGYGPKLQAAFDAAVVKFPTYYRSYVLMLVTLDPRWGGSIPAMYAFTDRYAGQASQFSPLKMLYVHLYHDLLNVSAAACWSYKRDKDRMSQCVTTAMQKIQRPSLLDRVSEALELYDHADKYQFGEVIRPLLMQMRWTSGGESYAAIMLQMAANAMHSNTELKDGGPGHNDFVIDEAVGGTWYDKGFYDNAMTKDQEALSDIEKASFTNEQDKAAALARYYEDMASTYNKLKRYPEMIAYEKAAIAVAADRDYDHMICYGYYQLGDYQRAVAECSEELAANVDNVRARYWRGKTYQAMGDTDSAIKELTSVAESQHSLRISAAIGLSLIYDDRKDFKSALGVLNKYTYLYSPKTNSVMMDIAVSYNNRCYNYMQLDELKKALEDCSSSLKYGTIPDAVRKQQELLKRLNAQGAL